MDLIKRYEGLHDGNKSTPILEPQKDPGGLFTLGWGARYDKNNKLVTSKTKAITKAEADELLKRDLAIPEVEINKRVKVPLTQNQFNALVSFVYNLGSGTFAKSSLLKNINTSSVKRTHFTVYSKIKNPKTGKYSVSVGVLRRRNEEADIFINN